MSAEPIDVIGDNAFTIEAAQFFVFALRQGLDFDSSRPPLYPLGQTPNNSANNKKVALTFHPYTLIAINAIANFRDFSRSCYRIP
jgi:hypothetical protein